MAFRLLGFKKLFLSALPAFIVLVTRHASLEPRLRFGVVSVESHEGITWRYVSICSIQVPERLMMADIFDATAEHRYRLDTVSASPHFQLARSEILTGATPKRGDRESPRWRLVEYKKEELNWSLRRADRHVQGFQASLHGPQGDTLDPIFVLFQSGIFKVLDGLHRAARALVAMSLPRCPAFVVVDARAVSRTLSRRD